MSRTKRLTLSRPYPSRYGAPEIRAVEPVIFHRTYFTDCLGCTFCGDACCTDGVDVDACHHDHILAHADAIERLVGIPRDGWFEEAYEVDPEVPGGRNYRTRVVDGACVFHNTGGRGCLLHRYALEHGLDYRDFKSLVDCLFPLSFYDGTLCPADDVDDGSLVCLDQGPTLYRGVRDTLRYYFGGNFVAELDDIEAARGGRLRLPD